MLLREKFMDKFGSYLSIYHLGIYFIKIVLKAVLGDTKMPSVLTSPWKRDE